MVWGSRLLVIGGHVKGATDDVCEVWMLDTSTSSLEWTRLELKGTSPPPCARGGHTATILRGTNEVVVFGGEDKRGRLLNDVHVIDLKDMTWNTPAKGSVKGAAPTPRKGHVAACLPGGGKDIIYVFGGVASSSSGEVSGELFALDAAAMTWRAVQPGGATRAAPRAGATGAVVGDAWYICGGGGSEGGRKDTVALKRSGGAAAAAGAEVEWVAVTEVETGSSLAAEGATVLAVGGGGGGGANVSLLAFGGYDGVRYSNDVHVMKNPAAAKAKLANGNAATAAAAAAKKPPMTPVKTKAAPPAAAKDDAMTMGAVPPVTTDDKMTPRKPAADVASSVLVESQQLWVDPNGDPFNVVTAGHESAAHELRLMRRQLATAKAELAESEKECAAVRAQLSDEQAKTLRLETQLAELQARESQRAELEQEADTAARRERDRERERGGGGGGGIWGFIAGSAPPYVPSPREK